MDNLLVFSRLAGSILGYSAQYPGHLHLRASSSQLTWFLDTGFPTVF